MASYLYAKLTWPEVNAAVQAGKLVLQEVRAMRFLAATAIVCGVLVAGACAGTASSTSPGRQEIKVTAKQFEYEPSEIRVKFGVPAKLVVTSADVDHQMAIVGLEPEKVITQGRVHALYFTPTKRGRYEFRCVVPCGTGHDEMRGVLIVE